MIASRYGMNYNNIHYIHQSGFIMNDIISHWNYIDAEIYVFRNESDGSLFSIKEYKLNLKPLSVHFYLKKILLPRLCPWALGKTLSGIV